VYLRILWLYPQYTFSYIHVCGSIEYHSEILQIECTLTIALYFPARQELARKILDIRNSSRLNRHRLSTEFSTGRTNLQSFDRNTQIQAYMKEVAIRMLLRVPSEAT